MKHIALFIFLTCIAAPVYAGNGKGGGDNGNGGGNSGGQGQDHDHDSAREAVKQGEARPLADILPAVERRYKARLVAVRLELKRPSLIYRLELISAAGRIIDVVVDAATGDIVDDDLAE